jgi:hypothetical protein
MGYSIKREEGGRGDIMRLSTILKESLIRENIDNYVVYLD